MTDARIKELAEEATDCIENCDLTAEEIESYLYGFMAEVVAEALTPSKKGTKRAKRKP